MDDEPLIRRAALAMLALVFLGAFTGTTVSAKEVPKLPIQKPTATASPMPTNSPTPTRTRTPEPTPTEIPTPTATLTFPEIYASEAVEITANIVVNRCLFYVNTTLGWLEREDSNYHILTVDDLPLILAVMANESACDPSVVSSAGAIGVMQVIPKPYYGTCLDQTPCCIYWGIWILDRAIEMHGLEKGLAAYNCSLEGIANDACGPTGGVHYSEEVRTFWYPRFVLALEEIL
jgi:hypothetical protein